MKSRLSQLRDSLFDALAISTEKSVKLGEEREAWLRREMEALKINLYARIAALEAKLGAASKESEDTPDDERRE